MERTRRARRLLLASAVTFAVSLPFGVARAVAQVGDGVTTDGTFVTDGFADASGGDAGSARGGEGGRGGAGTLPTCNENTNGDWWDPELDCAAGGIGGSAGDGGYSDGGDGGLAFTVDNTPPPAPEPTVVPLVF